MNNKLAKITVSAVLAASFLAAAAQADGIKAKDIVKKFEQVEASNNVSQLVRSNSKQYWGFMKEADLSTLAPYLKFTGVVAGDPHLGNFSVLPVKNEGGSTNMRFINIDFDDAGRGPYVLDFIKYVIAAEAANEAVKKGALIEAYLLGLKGKEIEPPKAVRKLLEMKVSEYYDEVEDYVDKRSKNDEFKMIEGEIAPYKGKISRSAIESAFPDMKVLDIATRPMDRGGSANNIRIWVLARTKKGEKRIMELKSHSESAMSSYQEQPDVRTWLQEVRAAFWPGIDPSSYDLVDVKGGGLFWIREKKKTLLSVDYKSTDEKDVKLTKELSVYVANTLGLAHGRQAGSEKYTDVIEQNPEMFKSAIEPFVKEYLASARRALENSKK